MILPGGRKRNPKVFLEDINNRISFAYKPQGYPGDMTLFRPQENFSFVRDPKMGWGELVKGGMDIVDLPVNTGGI